MSTPELDVRIGLVCADRRFRGGNAKGHNYPQVDGSGCPKEMSSSEIISDGFSEAKVVA